MIINKKQITIKPARITIDKLGEMINNGFKEVDKRIDDLDTKFEKKIDDLDTKFEKRIDDLDTKFEKKIDDLDKKVDFRFNGLQNRMDNTNVHYITTGEHNFLKERVNKVEKKVFAK
ncbi:MAG: hypothetical protein A3C79_02125 [Candidatus Taylorbacteria bacterium RIFCSPHIGHO2_02_FULL_45_28]|uniref:t-SNARE coiled-coil homology domain-containing protein n=1 Tax=Candidatus Taylorbacteria bacterium RIFCSPHIGHO2_12_FULL_45_16 TaxID=1802315 RepID=A0A1G2N2L8_9BACT|nr:MAG: hypothetical protein A2830_02930 [Candidatus Taylorbacteria bacterium RIFCSPHIGHO2_01_FULL_44_110]OHA25248.1 MAG: hypothetical protein A3C79_02125 [Candidatus Taylorbacteria bacterium RIFCSPHIGHO2_02_FULL_45_28]OHA29491.1 MAG: hypothetical protein A3F51_00435 [Candidatus Taylorbacteria bacterium RIFCSPHIGHO2_12_FULL_45_16]OHA33253.1 MAG: hypothetical protein A3A23_02965 [Candidatus Taylorbacteria bacterium RIFCSPLOWO2_01_FULL_45_59]OHA38302.1 MAG: hypothetical protein A3I98_03235 [Candi